MSTSKEPPVGKENVAGRDESALGPYRVLDLTNELGVFGARMLSCLGADVIKIEPPGGDPMRLHGPFFHDSPHPERSLFWLLYNVNKRSVTLDLESVPGRQLFCRLVNTAHFVLECFPPGYLDGLGIGYESLKEGNPSLVWTAIGPFGSQGPRAAWKGGHLVASAMSGFLQSTGSPELPPVQVSLPVTELMTGSYACVGAMMAHFHRQRTGEGQFVDVSAQESMMAATQTTSVVYKSHGVVGKRDPSGPYLPGIRYERRLFACQDGYITCYVTYWPDRRQVREWMAGEGMGEDLFGEEWHEVFEEGGEFTGSQRTHIYELFEAFALTHQRDHLVEAGQSRGIQVCAVKGVDQVFEDLHLRERGYFVNLEHPELGTGLPHQGAPFGLGESPWRIWRRAPFIGEHNEEVFLGELELSPPELTGLQRQGVV
jgi:crotonobetainyl-CoA:carnitine CoA-transferase CaiB-like acyl-CoA transferase